MSIFSRNLKRGATEEGIATKTLRRDGHCSTAWAIMGLCAKSRLVITRKPRLSKPCSPLQPLPQFSTVTTFALFSCNLTDPSTRPACHRVKQRNEGIPTIATAILAQLQSLVMSRKGSPAVWWTVPNRLSYYGMAKKQ